MLWYQRGKFVAKKFKTEGYMGNSMGAAPQTDKQAETKALLSKIAADATADPALMQRMREAPLSVLKDYGVPVSPEAKELSQEELDRARGGMKSDPNYTSQYVIDARGGQFTFLGVTYSFDVNGHISDIS